jgi:hypothetical protein
MHGGAERSPDALLQAPHLGSKIVHVLNRGMLGEGGRTRALQGHDGSGEGRFDGEQRRFEGRGRLGRLWAMIHRMFDTTTKLGEETDHSLVLFGFLFDVANFLCDGLEGLLVVGILCLKLCRFDQSPALFSVDMALTLLLLCRDLLLRHYGDDVCRGC